eukprot:g8380.t1
MGTSILVMITIVVVKIARVLPRTEHTFWLHQPVCGVMHHMKNWGPLPDTSAYWLERQQKFLKGQVHSQKDPEMTLFKRWSDVAYGNMLMLRKRQHVRKAQAEVSRIRGWDAKFKVYIQRQA